MEAGLARGQSKDLPAGVEPMTIVLLVVGTFGDVQPFLTIARRLVADGHRVRLASHPEYRSVVRAWAL